MLHPILVTAELNIHKKLCLRKLQIIFFRVYLTTTPACILPPYKGLSKLSRNIHSQLKMNLL